MIKNIVELIKEGDYVETITGRVGYVIEVRKNVCYVGVHYNDTVKGESTQYPQRCITGESFKRIGTIEFDNVEAESKKLSSELKESITEFEEKVFGILKQIRELSK
jgi:hypothetical protein